MYQPQVDPNQALLSRVKNFFTSVNVDEFIIERLIITETGSYNNMFSRPYTLDTSPEKLNRFKDMVDSVVATGARPPASSVAASTPGLVTPMSAPESLVPIVNGWENKRLRFNMVVRVKIMGSYRMYVYQGYSDYADFSISGHIDPNMPFTINSVTVANRTTGPDGRMYDSVIDTFNVLQADVDAANLAAANAVAARTLRPTDVFVSSSVNNFTEAAAYGNVVDATGVLSPVPVASSRDNNEPTKYVSKVIGSYIVGNSLSDMGSSVSDSFINASNTAAETTLSDDFLMRVLGLISNTGHHVQNNFTLSELSRLDDTLPSRINLVKQVDKSRVSTSVVTPVSIVEANATGVHHVGQSEYWDNVSVTTTMAVTICNSINTIMSDLLLTKAAFTIAPGTSETGPVFVPANGKSLLNLDINALLGKLRDRFLMEVYKDITHNGMIGVGLAVNADIFNETWVEISVNGQSPILYVLPTFVDSRLSPVVTYNTTNYNDTVADFGVLFDQITGY